MKRLMQFGVAAILLILASAPAYAQRQSEKEAQKAKQEQEMRENKERALELIDNKTFVLKAHTLYDRHLNSYQVQSNTNFVKINGDQAAVQLAFNNVVGWNGLGGITVTGHLTGFKVSDQDGLGPITVRADISSTSSGFLSLYMTVFPDGLARATVTGDFGSRVTFSGYFVDLDGSGIYQGMERY